MVEEDLIQLAGNLRGRALQEWNLLSEGEHLTFNSAVKSLRNCLESGAKAMAAQDFQHCTQRDCEEVSNFITRLEKTSCLAYGHGATTKETRDTVLYGNCMKAWLSALWRHLQSLEQQTTLACAQRPETKREGRLSCRRGDHIRPQLHDTSVFSLPSQSSTWYLQQGTHQSQSKQSTPQPTATPQPRPYLKRTSKPKSGSSHNGKSFHCYKWHKPGHITCDCPQPRQESTGPGAGSRQGGGLEARMIQSDLAEARADGDDDPLGCLLSDSDSPDEGV